MKLLLDIKTLEVEDVSSVTREPLEGISPCKIKTKRVLEKKLVAHHLLPASTLQSAVVSAVAHSATSTLQSTAASAVAHSAATSDGSKEVSNREIS